MSGILSKKRPLSRYLKDYKHSQTHCSQCGKLLDRMVLVFRGKIINKNAIMRMDQPIDDAIWLSLQPELAAQCRFCSEISCKSHANYFDIMAFKQYLFQHTEMNHSTIREYVVRLRRLDEMLVVRDYPAEKFASSSCHQHIIDGLPLVAHKTYRIALRKYEQFLAWRRSC
ncbi:flagella biosynthesis regulatory protein FliZ [Serratia symbiotica]|uniref:flagella biosynthesis regulatory protein FliZ n=1 Tax=Serratia symbiotica TaxID=138074 RepID=UPI00136028E3|nr:flagella biosynthesis regulatory protein FliZ [Serratia symbiotica]MBF1996515.1 flagella biosynthesis regulatory protein FliZ [Serratia symbiotica]MBQ0956806.1 flagella biosynthesis regulatory protein FliZ [Serratia symbiotica]